MKLIQFGAGNIGRSFIGQVFSRAGWEVVFVDVDQRLVKLLNEKRFYTVAIKREGRADETRQIGPVRAVNGRDTEAVAADLAGADLAGTSVGKNALPKVLPVIAKGLAVRFGLEDGHAARHGEFSAGRPLDIIIAENDREAPALFRSVLSAELGPELPEGNRPARPDLSLSSPAGFSLETMVGLVETSIGKMVPIMKAADLAEDPLLLFAEEYETLIVDKLGFRGPLPEIPSLHPVDPIAAYVDRKLFIHNLGHAASAYLGYAAAAESGEKTVQTIPQALALPNVEESVRRAMNEAAAALVLEYPQSQYSGSYSRADLSGHIDDLLFRFKNSALSDTIHRVGRDLRRKLAREDRITGAMLLCAKHGLPFGAVAKVYRAALDFAAPAENGALFPADEEFRSFYELDNKSAGKPERILREVSGLDVSLPEDVLVIREMTALS